MFPSGLEKERNGRTPANQESTSCAYLRWGRKESVARECSSAEEMGSIR